MLEVKQLCSSRDPQRPTPADLQSLVSDQIPSLYDNVACMQEVKAAGKRRGRRRQIYSRLFLIKSLRCVYAGSEAAVQ